MTLPGGQPYLLPGGPFGCLLIHSITSSPQEMRWLGIQLNQNGFSVLAIRLFGHATRPQDLRRARYSDWIASMEDGISTLQEQCSKLIVVGASLGSALALIASAKLAVDAVVAISPPYDLLSYSRSRGFNLPNPILRWLKLGKQSFPSGPSLPGLAHQDKTIHPNDPTIPSRTISEIELLLTEMRRVLPSIDVPTLLIDTGFEKDDQIRCSKKILDRLETKRVKILSIKSSGSEENLLLERERVTGAITNFITGLPGFKE